ncbi:hypothetical protein [Photobacterium toruni]|uniref:Chalcone isomerase domain-containing protein n=1 Tax=Photobacterium toruni TaxID=1935446 RepID=A0A1T4RFK5_9GAMM|nr:hypothetical protein [Photobacterium toruni]MEC6813528.1 hypothetical protein [Photobacterium toruni]MEC6830661.1 hypothetical protein [Photobacterium toruni]SKA14451.1 hypothetical protein CZ814_01290 [Photobacterium toruni]
MKAYCILLLFVITFSTSQVQASSWFTWPTVGESTLKWGWWKIYIAQLKTPSGKYAASDPNLALIIRYLRDIDKEDLLSATDKQWQHLGIPSQQRQQWLSELAQQWPNVKQGDRLVFVKNATEGRFYQKDKLLGKPLSLALSNAFIAIWLSTNTAYPKLRLQLIGQ